MHIMKANVANSEKKNYFHILFMYTLPPSDVVYRI